MIEKDELAQATWSLEHRRTIQDVGSLITASASSFGTKIYIKPSEDSLAPISFADLASFAAGMTNFLLEQEVQEQERVAVFSHNSTLLILLFLSIISSRRVFVPINPKSGAKEIEYILKDAQPSLLISDGRLREKLDGLDCAVKKFVATEDAGFISNMVARKSENIDGPEADGDLDAEIVYTSGTTGDPKGVLLTHRNLLEDSFAIGRQFKFNHQDSFLTITPLVHNSGQITTTLAPLWCGGRTTAVRADMGLLQFWYFTDLYEATWSLGMPAHVNFLLEGREQPARSTLKGLLCGGAKLSDDRQRDFEKRFGLPIYNNYGLTETTSIAVCDSPDVDRRVPGSVGKPIFINEVRIVDNDREVPPMVTGEIRIKGPNVFKEYVNKADVTSQVLKNGWVHTGDLGYKDEQGNVFIVDRVDNMINVGGENVYPAEIENLIPRLDGIKEGVVSSIPHEILGSELVLIYERREGADVDPNQWSALLGQYLSRFKIPKTYVEIRELGFPTIPKAQNGKILRQKVKEQLHQKKVLKRCREGVRAHES